MESIVLRCKESRIKPPHACYRPTWAGVVWFEVEMCFDMVRNLYQMSGNAQLCLKQEAKRRLPLTRNQEPTKASSPFLGPFRGDRKADPKPAHFYSQQTLALLARVWAKTPRVTGSRDGLYLTPLTRSNPGNF
jgi:hypothetical protein